MRFNTIYLLFISLSLSCLHAAAQTTTAKTAVKISGELTKPMTLSMNDMLKMKHIDVAQKGKDGNMHNYTGVPVQDILEQAGVTMGKDLRGKNLAKYMLVKCADGYEVLFSLAELDSSFTDRRVILAYESEGKPLPTAQGHFRLVVPGENKPARSCMQVNEIVVRFAKE